MAVAVRHAASKKSWLPVAKMHMERGTISLNLLEVDIEQSCNGARSIKSGEEEFASAVNGVQSE